MSRLRLLFSRSGVDKVADTKSFEREKRLLFGVLASGATRIVSILAMLVTVPMVHKHLPGEEFGVWMTLTSLMLMVQFADMGVGNGLVTIISDRRGRDEHLEIVTAVAAAAIILIKIAMLFMTVSLIVIWKVDWSQAFKVFTISSATLVWSMIIFCLCLALTIPASLGQKIQWGFQESYLSNLWQMLGSIFSVFFVILTLHFSLGLPCLILSTAGGPLLSLLLSTLQQFFFRRPWLKPKFSLASSSMTTPILRAGAAWASYQGLLFVANGSDGIFVTALFGAKEMGTYGTMLRMVSGLSIALLATVPLWPVFAEALSRRDFHWAKRTGRRALVGCTLIGLAAGCLLLFAGQWMAKTWIGSSVEPSKSLVVAFSALVLVSNVFSGVSALMANAVLMKKMMVVTTIGSLAAVALKFPLGSVLGPAGVCWASVIGTGFSCTAGYFVISNALERGDGTYGNSIL